MTRTLSLRPVRVLLATALVAAGAVALPATGAAAATATVNISVTGGYNNTVPLGTASGTVTGTSSTTASYSVTLCGRSSYATSTLKITAGSASVNHYVSNQSCQTFTGTLTSGSPFTTATAAVTSGTFYPGNTYTTYTRDQTLYVNNATPTPTPTPGVPVARAVSVSVTGGYNGSVALGQATGTITGAPYGTSVSYSVTLCGRNSYATSTLKVTAGSASAQHYVSNQSCQTFTGNLTSTYAVTGASATVTSGTFYPGNTYTTYTRTGNVYF